MGRPVGTRRACPLGPSEHRTAEGVLDDDSIAAVAFGLRESDVGAVDQGGKCLVIGSFDDSEARRELGKSGNGDRGVQPDTQRVENVASLVGVAADESHDEFLTAMAADDILHAYGTGEYLREQS